MISQDSVPSSDEPILDQAIAEFLRAEAAGEAGDPQQWLERFPACAECLAAFFHDREGVDRLMAPVRVERWSSARGAESAGVFSPLAPPRASAADETIDLCPEPPLLSSTRYRPLSFHARGGMGEIWLAKDERIGRQVAVKKLRAGREMQQARFIVEAQITGQLEHPSIVPLHDIGVDDAGSPFYVMKFIHGRRFKDAIVEFHAQHNHADWPQEISFRRLLETFVSVCNVVAYAHHKGVLHRDIKPDNVMLGSYGETVVVDWGLAKAVGQPDEGRASAVRLSGSGSTATQHGAIIGSPLYISPEGAEGRPEAVDQASDVYLLGATLYELLCNRPPRQAASSWELIDLALHGRPTPPRQVDPRVPRALEAICMKAMAFDKRDRYESPLALAEDVERYLASAPTLAYREPLLTRAGRWMRRHRRRIQHCIAALAVVGLAAFSLNSHQRARLLADREQARDQFAEFLRLADEAQFYAANTNAIAERMPYYDPRRAERAGVAALAEAARWGATGHLLPFPELREELLTSRYTLLLLMAQTRLHGEPSEIDVRQALTLLDEASTIQPPSRGYYQLRSRCFTRLIDSSAAEAEQYRARAPDVRITAHDHFLAGELLRWQDVGTSGPILGGDQADIHRTHLGAASDEYRQALTLDPRHFWARFQLGRCLLAQGRAPEAVETLSACVALQPAAPWAYSARGLALAIAGQPDEAIHDFDEALRFDAAFHPARLNRGVVRWLQSRSGEALADFSEVLAAPVDGRLSEAAFYRGQLLLEVHRDREALADFTAVIADQSNFQPAFWLRAKTHFQLDDVEAGLLDLKKYLALDRRASDSEHQAKKHLTLGKALRNMAQQLVGSARSAPLRASAEELRRAISGDPASAESWKELGAVLELLGNHSEAIEAYTQGLSLAAADIALYNMRAWAYVDQQNYELARADFSETLRRAPQDAEAHAGLGFVLAELGDDDAARREASAALLAAANSQLVLHNVACVYARLSATSSARRIEHENLALAALDRAVSISRQSPIGPDADEVTIMRQEKSFPRSLQERPEFQRLLSSGSGSPPPVKSTPDADPP